MSFSPLGKRLLVEEIIESEKKEGSIIIPDVVAKVFSEGYVRYIGDEVTKLKVGDKVLFPSNAGNHIKQDGVVMKLMQEAAIEAII